MRSTSATTSDPPAALLDRRALARYLSTSVRTLDRLNDSGRIPSPIYVGSMPRWRRCEIDVWLAAGAPDRATWDTLRAGQREGGAR